MGATSAGSIAVSQAIFEADEGQMKELGDDFNVITGKYTRRIISRLILERSLLLQMGDVPSLERFQKHSIGNFEIDSFTPRTSTP